MTTQADRVRDLKVGDRVVILFGDWQGVRGTITTTYPSFGSHGITVRDGLTIEKTWWQVRPLSLIEQIGELA